MFLLIFGLFSVIHYDLGLVVGSVFSTINSVNSTQSQILLSNNSNTIPVVKPYVNYRAHVFYYAWYGAPKIDGKWWHWNHEYIPPWDKNDHNKYPTGAHNPDKGDIGANFFPTLGPYSSRDKEIIDAHMFMMAKHSIGVVSLSWYPPGQADENGPPTDGMVGPLLNAAHKYGLQVCLHVEPYEGRSPETLKKNLEYVHQTYGDHPAFYKVRRGSKSLPLFYIYDSYRTKPSEWARLLSSRGDISIRNTELDAVFIGLLVEYKHRVDIKKAGFDGFYTYFASNGFSYGSSWLNWKSLASFAFKNSLIFIPSVGPGYIDTRVRAWNDKNTKHRSDGKYFEMSWKTALKSPAKYVSITSFNEWHEGTQIEPSKPMECEGFKYLDFSPRNPEYYLQLSSKWIKSLKNDTTV